MNSDTLRRRWSEFLVAMSLLSRLPLPALPERDFENAARAAWAYPLVGLVVSLPGVAAASILMAAGCGAGIAAGAYLAVSCLLTGAMHEDGLADCADGFWGGSTPERRLEIMKDSAIGTYGTMALILVTGLRWIAAAAVLSAGPAPLLAAAVLSRAMMPLLMLGLAHARATGLSRQTGRPTRATVLACLVVGLSISALPVGGAAMVAMLISLTVVILVGWVALRKIRGQTGDVLGACQQLTELSALLSFVALSV